MPEPEIMGIPCAQEAPHAPHSWQMSATGYCGCPGVPSVYPPAMLPQIPLSGPDISDSAHTRRA